MNKKTVWLLLLLTPFFFLISHAIAYMFHEYAHSFSAWILGYKSNPFALHYGNASLQNLLLQSQISENVDYSAFEKMHAGLAAFIAFAGAGIGNVLLLLLSLIGLYSKVFKHFMWRYFFFWLIIMCLGNFIAYVPIRTFASSGDIYIIESVLNISPWWIMILLGYPVFYSFWCFYNKILPFMYETFSLNCIAQTILLIISTFVLFALFGLAGLSGYGEIAHFSALFSIYASPLIVAAHWPHKKV